MTTTPRVLEIRQKVLSKNDELARSLRARFHGHGLFTLNFVSGPGTGKTRFLEETLRRLVARGLRPVALVGDLATDNDAQRLMRSGVPVKQITTAGRCHLEAEMIAGHLEGWDLDAVDILFIENVGNMICPTDFRLGAEKRIVIISSTEGDDVVNKHPMMFRGSTIGVINKVDLAPFVGANLDRMERDMRRYNPEMQIFRTNMKTGEGIEELLGAILA